jgi:uncharacterized membrane protein
VEEMKPAKAAGMGLAVLGICLLVIGGIAYAWPIFESQTTPGGLFSDPVTNTYRTYPYREIGTWMFFTGFTAIILGVIIFVIQDHIYKPQIIEKIKIRCEYCNGLMDESEDKCPGCGGR